MKDRILYISISNVFACIGVVFLHCNHDAFWGGINNTPRINWSANLIEVLFYWAVPVFFMNSGALLLEYREKYTTAVFFRKRFYRTVIPFIFWSIMGLIYDIVFNGYSWHGNAFMVLQDILNCKFISIYSFFINLFAIYLSMPLFSVVAKEDREKTYKYVILLSFVFNACLPTFFALASCSFNQKIIPPVATGYIIYPLIGYLIKEKKMPKKQRILLYLLGIGGVGIQLLGTVTLSIEAGSLSETLKGYTNFPAIMESVAIMVMFRYIPWDTILPHKVKRLLIKCSQYTFGVYLIHIFPVKILPSLLGISSSSIIFRTVGALIIFVICMIISAAISSIPLVKRLVGC